MPGVMTPLSWSIWGPASERGGRGAFVAMGALERARGGVAADQRDLFINIFYGRVAARVDFLAEMGDRLPGTSGQAIAEQFLGTVPEGLRFSPTLKRLPVIAAKLPYSFAVVKRRMVAEDRRVADWWPRQLSRTPSLDLAQARAQFSEGAKRFDHVMSLQANGMFIGVQPVFDQVIAMIARAGAGHLQSALLGGGGSHAETEMVDDLWELARERITLRDFLARHGYHGPLEGEISGRVWREDARPVLSLAEKYAARSEEHHPAAMAQRRREEREDAERELVAGLPRVRRAQAHGLLALARRNMPMRGIGKVTYLRSLDIARAGARRAGELLADQGALKEPEDVFLLTAAELGGALPDNAIELVEERKQERAEFERLELPTAWRGAPEVRPKVTAGSPGDAPATRLAGICGSGGVVEGRVRVVDDPTFTEVEPDEILVAATTDPSWASVLFLCKALIVDIGGVMSHASVVARELGIPCVINTQTGTRDLHTGDQVRVDGSRGVVEILSRNHN
jgi:phosphohistidine swiveling domain-containing protein